MQILGDTLSTGSACFLGLALLLALTFEFVNGFHDTANAVATVIYTHALKPNVAVVWSGCWNLLGVLTSSGAVAFGVLALLPVELVINVGTGAGFAMVFALLISAIIWNLGTWYLGLPASSSHTLIGSIMGVGLANSLYAGHAFGEGVNWSKAKEVGTSLLVSPVVGFVFAGLLLLALKLFVKKKELFTSPEPGKAPPFWIRSMLVLTCTGVSFFHGSNDGQKGMGLIMLILIGLLPGTYALNLGTKEAALQAMVANAHKADTFMARRNGRAEELTSKAAEAELARFLESESAVTTKTFVALASKNRELMTALEGRTTFDAMSKDERRAARSNVYLVSESIAKLQKAGRLTAEEAGPLMSYRGELDKVTRFIPSWVKIAVALALGLGTMIGWKRIVVTVGEKIGKEHLTYAQGASAEIVAMATIGAADFYGLPVSTTHVLSSGVAGTMAANHSGLQMDTLRNLLLAWVLTLPVCVLLGATTFSAGLFIVFKFSGLQ